MSEIPYGYCHCGCGERTNLARQDFLKLGIKAGQPYLYRKGHHQRKRPDNPPNPTGLCMCGCGQKTTVATMTNIRERRYKGYPMPFVLEHNIRVQGKEIRKKSSEHYQSIRIHPNKRFWKWVIKKSEDECWIWIGGTKEGGYGVFHPAWEGYKKRILAHRFSYEMVYGKVPDNLFVLHKCDNPPCVNPKHLFVGTAKDNSEDMVIKGRCKATKLTEQEVLEIRELRKSGLRFHEIASRYSITTATACDVANHKTWKHVT